MSHTSLDELSGHEERRGTRGTVVIDVDDRDSRQSQPVVYSTLSASRVACREETHHQAKF